jgi:hypothetical protein
LLAACVAAFTAGFGPASAQVNERREAPIAAPEALQGQRNPRFNPSHITERAPPGAPAPETAGRSPNRDAASASSASEERKSIAEARRVRDAVSRTLERAHESSRVASD